jgi:hypothetical protein
MPRFFGAEARKKAIPRMRRRNITGLDDAQSEDTARSAEMPDVVRPKRRGNHAQPRR